MPAQRPELVTSPEKIILDGCPMIMLDASCREKCGLYNVDTNILVYSIANNQQKRTVADALLLNQEIAVYRRFEGRVTN